MTGGQPGQRTNPQPASREWMKDAFCRGVDPELFFAHSRDTATQAAANNVCRYCPVQQQCAEYADATDSHYGTWAGEHRSDPQAQKASTRPIPNCGTTGGYARHRRRKEQPCRRCMEAHSRYRAQLKRLTGK